MSEEHENLERPFPSVGLAYDLAVRSDDLSVERADAMNSKIQSLISLSCALTFAIPVAARSLKLDLSSHWFTAIVVIFGLTVVVGFVGRFFIRKGDIKCVDPGKLHEDWLHLSEGEFKKHFTEYAGWRFKQNNRLITARWRCAIAMSFLLSLEVLFMALWMATHP